MQNIVIFSLEKRLAQRRAKVSELKQKQEVLEITAKSEGKDNKKQVAELVSRCISVDVLVNLLYFY